MPIGTGALTNRRPSWSPTRIDTTPSAFVMKLWWCHAKTDTKLTPVFQLHRLHPQHLKKFFYVRSIVLESLNNDTSASNIVFKTWLWSLCHLNIEQFVWQRPSNVTHQIVCTDHIQGFWTHFFVPKYLFCLFFLPFFPLLWFKVNIAI